MGVASEYDQRNNRLIGIFDMIIGMLISSIFTALCFWIYPFGLFFVADIYFVIGCVLGIFYTLKNRKEAKSHIKIGILVGLVSAALSLVLISFIDWLIYTVFIYKIYIDLFFSYTVFVFIYYGIMYIFVGIVIGYLVGNYYKKRQYVESPLL